jgi:EAL domain-containing protein (putative c-di-GMP-specific phosphodiesterase class I)
VDGVVAYLEGFVASVGRLVHLPIHSLPCRIGRRVELELQLNDSRVSQLHAEIFQERDSLWLRDLASTNGTFVNGQRVTEPILLQNGDLIRFAVLEFRFNRNEDGEFDASDRTALISQDSLGPQFFAHRDLLDLIQEEAVTPYFQPIVALETQTLAGYEVLGRGSKPGLPHSPTELFKMAATYGMEANLSELFREVGIRVGAPLALNRILFVNMHPEEIRGTQLIQSLKSMRHDYPDTPVVLELHESAITDVERIQQLRSLLRDLSIGLAYDDFGAGRARLNELGEIPPDYLKFDVSLIRQIHSAGPAKQQLVERLVQLARDMGVSTLAEGVELPQERDVCEQMGFDLAQGYMFGKPKPVEETAPPPE